MQAASDVFLGHMVSPLGQHLYVRQLRDVKVKSMIEIFTPQNMLGFARNTARALARAHARSGDAAVIAGYIGKSDELAEAVAEFAVDYAEQNERDHAALVAAVRAGRIETEMESE
jgi:predicted alpha/beta hydrolase